MCHCMEAVQLNCDVLLGKFDPTSTCGEEAQDMSCMKFWKLVLNSSVVLLKW